MRRVEVTRKTKGIVRWRVADLHEHPQQRAMFGDLSDDELEALTEDLRKHGLRNPIEALPDGTIVAGHQRLRAAKKLGWEEVDVIIREDLAAAGDTAQETFFINDNLLRRHLGPLAKARCLHRLLVLETEGRTGTPDRRKKEILKARIGERLGVSLRTVSRYLLVLKTPREIQVAFDAGKVTLIAAGRVALLSRSKQREIAQRLAEGEQPKRVLAQYLTRPGHHKLGDAVERFMRAFKRALAELDGRLDEVRPAHVLNHLPTLREAQTAIMTLIHKAKQKPRTVQEAFADFFAADDQ
jgi:ParB family chromosome partitioning protein